ncbi:MAG: FtsX-like permease family protein [Proteobacteria bacterium]|nr:FtsX-like permease family protein [Pseudomonadota bacterium]
MTFREIAFKNLFRHKVRNFLTLLGIITSVTVLYSILSFNKSFINNLNEELNKTGVHFMVVPAGCPHEVASLVLHGAVIPKFLQTDIEDKLKEKLDKQYDVLSPILVFQLPNQEKQRIDLIYGLEMDNVKNLKPWWKVIGKTPQKENEILIGFEIADHDKIKIGDKYKLNNKEYEVSGIIEKTTSKDDAFIYIPLKEAQTILAQKDGITAIGVKLKNAEALNDTIDRLSREIPGIQIVTINQILTSISTLAAGARVLSLSVVAIAILISTIGILNVILMTVFERTQEIGMMRAIGASRAHIFRIIIEESVILSTLGGLIGILLALLLSKGIEKFVKSFMPYVPQGDLVVFDLKLGILCFFFTVFLGLIAGLYPAFRATKISPIEAIKG